MEIIIVFLAIMVLMIIGYEVITYLEEKKVEKTD